MTLMTWKAAARRLRVHRRSARRRHRQVRPRDAYCQCFNQSCRRFLSHCRPLPPNATLRRVRADKPTPMPPPPRASSARAAGPPPAQAPAARAPATARGPTPRTQRLYKLLSGNPTKGPMPTAPSRPRSGGAVTAAGTGGGPVAGVRLDLNEPRPKSAANPVPRSGAAAASTYAAQSARPASVGAPTAGTAAASLRDRGRPHSARPSEASNGAVRTSGHRAGGYQRNQAQPTVDAMVRRYKQSVAAWNAKHDYAFGEPSARPPSASAAQTYRQGRRPPSAPATAARPSSGTARVAQRTEPQPQRAAAPPSAPREQRRYEQPQAPARAAPPPAIAEEAGYKPRRVETRNWAPDADAAAPAPHGWAGSNALASTQRGESEPVTREDMEKNRMKQMVSKLLAMSKDPIHMTAMEFYSIGRVLGEGAFGKVKLANHNLSGEKVAVKIFEKFKIRDDSARKRVIREIRNLQRIQHPSIIKLFEVIDSAKRMCLVIEYANGGDLCKYVRAKRRLDENEARRLLAQIACGIHICHANNVVHRDIKLENCLLDSRRICKIVDFGFSTAFRPGQKLKTFCGSPSYAAPEIISRKPYIGPPVDVWSLGVLLFGMLAGYFPFQGDTADDLYRRVLRGDFKAPNFISRESRDLLRRMLTVDPARRATIEDVLAHPWTAAAFTSSAYGYPAGSYHYKYMRRLVGHLRHADTSKLGSGGGTTGNSVPWWNQMHDVPPPPPRSSASMAGAADGTPQDAAAEARLAEMLGCAPPSSRSSKQETTTGPHDGTHTEQSTRPPPPPPPPPHPPLLPRVRVTFPLLAFIKPF